MIKRIIYIACISSIPLISYSQDTLSKKEIYNIWRYEIENRKIIDTNFDSIIVSFVDSLKMSMVDTLGIFSRVVTGSYLRNDTCESGVSPWTAHIQWIKNGVTYTRKITQYCTFLTKEIDSSSLITYYLNNKEIIDKERIMPVILNATIKSNRKVVFSSQSTSSSTIYEIYCEYLGNSKFTRFEDYFFENEKNIYYSDNINSKTNIWRKLIEKQIREIDNN